jgi:hypothetical protein
VGELENLTLRTKQHAEPSRLPPTSAQAQTETQPKIETGQHEAARKLNPCELRETQAQKNEVLLHGQDFLHRLQKRETTLTDKTLVRRQQKDHCCGIQEQVGESLQGRDGKSRPKAEAQKRNPRPCEQDRAEIDETQRKIHARSGRWAENTSRKTQFENAVSGIQSNGKI